MSAKDEARYAAAIEASAGQGYQIIEDGEMLTMDTETGKLIVRPAPKSTTTNHNADTSSNDQNNADKTNDQNNADKSSGDKPTRDTLAKMTTHDGGRTFDVDESTYNEFSIKALRPCSLDSPSNLSKMALACLDTASHTSQIPSKTSI